MDKIKPYLKAVVGFVAPAAVTIGAAITSSSDGGTRITQTEWITALVACVVTSAGVYGVPNKDRRGLHQRESVQPPNA